MTLELGKFVNGFISYSEFQEIPWPKIFDLYNKASEIAREERLSQERAFSQNSKR